MIPVYKSLMLSAMALQVSLALNAETRDDESSSTMALQAELLDSLRVELVTQNVSGVRDLIASGECVIDGSSLTVTLDTSGWTRGAMYRVQVLATLGTQTQVIYALNIIVPRYVALSDTPQEFSDSVTIVSTITDVTESDLEGLALEATSQEIKTAITPISVAAKAYNTGKTELAANITAKGVQASASETLPELAAKVRDIAQTTTEIIGGEMYGAQLFGDANPAQSLLWNLYDVLAQMKTRFMGAGQYAALIVCEYYKGYDSLQLQGADAYYTCDGDLYETSMPLHVWHDSDNERANRWVCFLFATEGARLDITNTAISPRSMYIGGHIGTIEYFVNGRLTDLVCGVESTDKIDNFNVGYKTNPWNKNIIIRNFKISSALRIDSTITDVVDLEFNNLTFDASVLSNDTGMLYFLGSQTDTLKYIRIKGLIGCVNGGYQKPIVWLGRSTGLIELHIPDLVNAGESGNIINGYAQDTYSLQAIFVPKLTTLTGYASAVCRLTAPDLIDLTVGEMVTGLPFSRWNPTSVLADATKKAQLIDNIKNHILARVSDATGGTQLVFTISTNMYNAIASEQIEWQGETMSLADAFITKNWLLAGA